MRFGPLPVAEAVGGVVAHGVKAGPLVLKKGQRVTPDVAAALEEAGVREIVVALLEEGDVPEDAAAERLAAAAAGPGLAADRPFTGRVNLFAAAAGVLRIDAAKVNAANAVDEAITIATLPDLRRVQAGEMAATVKIIPFAVPTERLERAVADARGAMSVAPFRTRRVAVVSTLLPGLKPSVVDKTLRVLDDRLAALAGSTRISDRRSAHGVEPLSRALRDALADDPDIVVVFGASAITDRRDVIPAALLAAGGRVAHLGMPVDPGNLLMLGELAGRPVIGAPSCARSPKENGFDWVLERLAAGVPVTSADIRRMGVGGLLMEIVSRPQPRDPERAAHPPIAAVVLAAGLGSRMGGAKMTVAFAGEPLARWPVKAAIAAGLKPVVTVIGHDAAAVRAALAGLDTGFVENADYRSGLASSVRAGVAAVPADCAGAIMLLGDMPRVTPAILRRLAAAFADNPGVRAVVPTVHGRRGNPILIGRRLFDAVASLTGDIGARRLVEEAGDEVIEVAIDDDAVLADVDTPEALAALAAAER